MAELVDGSVVPAENGLMTHCEDVPAELTDVVRELTPAEKFRQKAELETSASPQTNGERTIRLPIDVSSDEAFPTIGGAKAKSAAAPVKWGANSSPVRVPEPDIPASNWTPNIGRMAQQTRYIMLKEDKRALADLRKPVGETVREIAKKTGTKIEAAVSKECGSTTYVILGGSPADRERAKRELKRELTVEVTRMVSVPAVIKAFIIGKGGSKIQELESKTLTKIRVPQSDSVDTQSLEYEDDAIIDVIIEGDTEGCALAAELIAKMVNERVIKVTRTITAPGKFYPFIQGAYKGTIQEYEKTVDQIIVPDYYTTSTPPPNFSEPSGPIQVHGEKTAVEQVVAKIRQRIIELEAAKHSLRDITVAPFQTQLFTIHHGRLIQEIYAQTGCAIIVPPVRINKVYVSGPASKLAETINIVLQKIEEYKIVTLDLCRAFSKASAGAKAHARVVILHAGVKPQIKSIESDCNVELIYPTSEVLDDLTKPCHISIVSKSKDSLDIATQRIKAVFGSYTLDRVAYVQIEPLHHKHIRGKDGRGAKKIAAQTSVELLFPEVLEVEEIALIYEGDSKDPAVISDAFEKAKAEIEELVKGQAEIVRKTIEVPQELHDKVRGERGIIINALNPSSVFVQFGIPPARPGRPAPVGDQNAENIITLRGPPANVNTTAANILTFLNDTKDKAVPDTVAEPFEYRKQYSGNLIGSKGANINKLRDELGVDIKLTEGIGEIRGFKVCVDAARRKLNSQIKELDDKAVITIKVPQQYHSIIIGSEGSTVKRLEERYSVRINFPRGQKPDEGRENSPRQAPDEIIIRGGKKGADEARQEIDDLWKYEAENSYTATITVLAKSVGYMFRNASKDIKQLRDESSARITIPQEDKNANPDDTVEIKIRGKKDAVTHAQSVLAKIAKNAENTSSVTINVEKKYHRSLIGFAGQTLKEIVVGAGGPDDRASFARMVRFPAQGSESDEIVVQGNSTVVNKIVEAINKIVLSKARQISDVIQVAPEKHRKLIGREGNTRRELESKFMVVIDIPRQQRSGQPQSNPDITLTGEPEAVEKAKAHIEEMMKEPEGETLEVPLRLHHAIADGGFFKQLHRDFKVTVDHNGLPRPSKPTEPKPRPATDLPLITDSPDEERISWEVVENTASHEEGMYPWVLHGKPENTTKARAFIEKAMETAENQCYMGFLILPDPRKYRFVVGPGGSMIERIRKDTGCRVTVPRNQASGEAITLHGERAGLERAKDMILEVIKSNGR